MTRPEPAPTAGAYPVPPLKRGGTEYTPTAPYSEYTESTPGYTSTSAPDLPLWAKEAQVRAARKRARRVYLKITRSAGLRVRHQTKINRIERNAR